MILPASKPSIWLLSPQGNLFLWVAQSFCQYRCAQQMVVWWNILVLNHWICHMCFIHKVRYWITNDNSLYGHLTLPSRWGGRPKSSFAMNILLQKVFLSMIFLVHAANIILFVKFHCETSSSLQICFIFEIFDRLIKDCKSKH